MNQTRRVGVIRIGIVLMMSVAWFAIANHCVLAAVEIPEAKATVARCQEACCGDQSPAKGKKQRTIECCKTLRATLTASPKKLGGYDTSLFALQPYFFAPVILANGPKVTLPGGELDTGPPFTKTFAELTLQRSILAHAPPSLA